MHWHWREDLSLKLKSLEARRVKVEEVRGRAEGDRGKAEIYRQSYQSIIRVIWEQRLKQVFWWRYLETTADR